MEVEINVREVVESRKGYTFLAAGISRGSKTCNIYFSWADFKSIELRVLAHLSGDAQLLSAFSSSQNADIFITLASEWYSIIKILYAVADPVNLEWAIKAMGGEREGVGGGCGPSHREALSNWILHCTAFQKIPACFVLFDYNFFPSANS